MKIFGPADQRDPGRLYPPPQLSGGQLAWRWLAAGGNFAIGTLVLVALTVGPGHPTGMWTRVLSAVDFVLGVGLLASVPFRRKYTWLALAWAVPSFFSSTGGVAYMWILASLATRRRWREILPVIFVQVMAAPLHSYVTEIVAPELALKTDRGEPLEPLIAALATTFMVMASMAVVVAIGFYTGARRDLIAALRERAETAERESELQVQAAQAEERARIAREMHDVLAHRISLVSMHAGILAFREDLDAEQTRQIAGIIQENAHASLTELRSVLGSLRNEGAAPELPQPTISDIGQLIEDQKLLGVDVHFDDQLKMRETLSPVVARQLYRMVQEALTNARKHAAGAPVWVNLYGRPGDGVFLNVRNATTHGTGVPGSGWGLVGLKERATIVGGTLTAGLEQGDFVVKAWCPWET